jgi:hypothetical protein
LVIGYNPIMSGSAARTREYRERQKAGRSVFFIEADSIALAEALTVAGFLQPSDDDHGKVCRALQAAVQFWIEQETVR